MAKPHTGQSDQGWASLLASLPSGEGAIHCSPMPGEAFAGWTEIRLVLGSGPAGLRVVTAMYDPEGRPGGVSDLVAFDGAHHQETVMARVEPDGRHVLADRRRTSHAA